MLKVKIEKGWYFSAGHKYGWAKDGVYSKGMHSHGVGIEKSILKNNKEITVEVEGQNYLLSCEEAREFVNKYKAAQIMPGGTVLGIISKDLFKKI